MLLINSAWNNSFARIDTNKKDITDRGWGPYNRNMFFSLIRLIITKSDKFSELNDYAILSINSSIYSKYNHLLFANNNYLKSRHNHIDIGNTLLENVTDKCRKLSEKSNNRESNRCIKQVYKCFG